MAVLMNKSFWRLMVVAGAAVTRAGCGNKATKEALQKATALEDQQQYQNANDVLVEALRAREAQIPAAAPAQSDPGGADALTKTVQADAEILKMERAQIAIYLHLERADLASAIYSDILAGHPGDSVVYDALHDKNALIRTGAVRVLGQAGKPGAIPALTGAARDEDKDVRPPAVTALGTIKEPATCGPWLDALNGYYWF